MRRSLRSDTLALTLASRWFALRAACGLAGPAAFTAAWAVGTARLASGGHRVGEVHISGLAAPDARTPGVMTAGFLALGGCTMVFAGALDEALGGPAVAGPGPRLMRLSGLGLVTAGLFRRDYMLNQLPPGVERQSRRNDAHDVASFVAFASAVGSLLALARRFQGDPAWAARVGPAVGAAAGATAVYGLFHWRRFERWNGVLQRIAVSLPLAAMAALAVRLLRHGGTSQGAMAPG